MRRTAALGSALLDALERDEGEGEEKVEQGFGDKIRTGEYVEGEDRRRGDVWNRRREERRRDGRQGCIGPIGAPYRSDRSRLS